MRAVSDRIDGTKKLPYGSTQNTAFEIVRSASYYWQLLPKEINSVTIGLNRVTET